MNLAEVLRPECISLGAHAGDKDAVLREIAAASRRSPILAGVSEEAIRDGLRERERLGSTGFGRGVAIPHCRLAEVEDFVVGIMTLPDGVDFDSVDGEPVNVIVYIVAPKRESNEHIRLLSAISQILNDQGATAELLAQTDPGTARECALKHAGGATESTNEGRTLFHIFVQGEDEFRDILQVLTGVETASTVVVEANSARSYLMKMPLFAGFWSDETSIVCRLIVAIVDRKLANETVRRIERVTGSLDERGGVLVTMQDIVYSAGSLET